MSYDQYRGGEGMSQFRKAYGCDISTSKVQKASFFIPNTMGLPDVLE